jgi:hypothetical protein
MGGRLRKAYLVSLMVTGHSRPLLLSECQI